MLNDSKIAQLNSERPLHQTAVRNDLHVLGRVMTKIMIRNMMMMRTTMVVMMTTIMTKFKLPRKPAASAVISCSPFKAAKAGRPTVFHLLSSSCDKDYHHHHHHHHHHHLWSCVIMMKKMNIMRMQTKLVNITYVGEISLAHVSSRISANY